MHTATCLVCDGVRETRVAFQWTPDVGSLLMAAKKAAKKAVKKTTKPSPKKKAAKKAAKKTTK